MELIKKAARFNLMREWVIALLIHPFKHEIDEENGLLAVPMAHGWINWMWMDEWRQRLAQQLNWFNFQLNSNSISWRQHAKRIVNENDWWWWVNVVWFHQTEWVMWLQPHATIHQSLEWSYLIYWWNASHCIQLIYLINFIN